MGLSDRPIAQQAIAPTRDCLQQCSICTKRLADGRDVNLNRIVPDNNPRPNTRHEVSLGDYFARGLNEYFDYLKGASADRNGHPSQPQLTPSEIDLP